MLNKEQILDLYYNEHLKQKEIADIVGTSTHIYQKLYELTKEIKKKKKIANKLIQRKEKYICKIISKLIIDQRKKI